VIRSATVLALVVALAGCSAKLGVTGKPDSVSPKGLVYRAPVTMIVIVRKETYTQSGRLCKEEILSEQMAMPLGDAYAVNIDNSTSWFAENEFTMSFNDQGLLKQVTLNSNPQLDETLTATASLVKEVAAIAAPAPMLAPGDSARAASEECGAVVKSRPLCVKTSDQWINDPHCPGAGS